MIWEDDGLIWFDDDFVVGDLIRFEWSWPIDLLLKIQIQSNHDGWKIAIPKHDHNSGYKDPFFVIPAPLKRSRRDESNGALIMIHVSQIMALYCLCIFRGGYKMAPMFRLSFQINPWFNLAVISWVDCDFAVGDFIRFNLNTERMYVIMICAHTWQGEGNALPR